MVCEHRTVFNHVATYAYVDVDFYEIDEISVDQLRLFGERASQRMSRTTGEYFIQAIPPSCQIWIQCIGSLMETSALESLVVKF